MMPSCPRRAFPALAIFLGAAALGLAGCAGSAGTSADSVKSLSDLPNKDRSMLKVGDASRAAGDCPAALRFYKLVVDKEERPGDVVSARIGAAECELSMGATGAAQQDYIAAIKLAPNDPAPLVGLGRVYLVEHKPGDAASYLDLALKKGANAAFVWNDKGVALDQLRRHKEAQDAYRQGLAAFPDDRALRNNLALSLAMSHELREAENLMRTLASEPGATARTRQNLALVLGLEGDDAGARNVSETDLDGAALDNNSRFYDYARALAAGTPLPSPTAGNTGARAVPETPTARTARAEVPVPPPVLDKPQAVAEKSPVLKFRAAAPELFEPPPPHDTAAIAQTELAAPKQTAAIEPAPVKAPTPLVTEKMETKSDSAAPVASSEHQ